MLSHTFKKYFFFHRTLAAFFERSYLHLIEQTRKLRKSIIFLKKGKTFGIRFESSEIGKQLVTLPHPEISDEGQIVTPEAIILRMGTILTFKACML